MQIQTEELETYINSSILAIKNGLKDTGFKIAKTVEFNLAFVNSSEGGGGLKIYVVKAEGKLKSEEINHIKFEVEPEINRTHINRFPRPQDSCR